MGVLHVALVTPLTDPLALYGKTCAAALTLWAKNAAYLPAGFTKVELDVQNSGEHLQETLQMGHQVVIVQWQQGQRRVAWPTEQAERPIAFSHFT
jgi:hypothetical protein